MAIDVKAYYDGLLKSAGVEDTKRQALLDVFGDEKVSKALAEDQIAPRLRHDEFSRNMDNLKAEKDKWTDWYTKEVARTQENQKAISEYEAKVRAYEAQYGPIENGNGDPKIHQVGDFLTKKDFEEKLQQQGNQMLTILEWAAKKPVEHYKTTGEILDVGAVKKIAVEKGLSLDQAYQELTAPLFAERQQKEIESKIAAAKAEGAREFASTHKMPIDSKPRDYHPIFDRKADAQPATERERANAFAEEWNKAGATSGEQ